DIYKIADDKILSDKKGVLKREIEDNFFVDASERQRKIGKHTFEKTDIQVKNIKKVEKSLYNPNKGIIEVDGNSPYVFNHEFAHAIEDKFSYHIPKEKKENFNNAIRESQRGFAHGKKNFTEHFDEKYKTFTDKEKEWYDNKYSKTKNALINDKKEMFRLQEEAGELRRAGKLEEYKETATKFNELVKKSNDFAPTYLKSKDMEHQLSDIIDMAVTTSQGGNHVILGHRNDFRVSSPEIFAELFTLESAESNNESARASMGVTKKLFPDIVKAYDDLMVSYLEHVGGI
ncbi:MAG: hypothetical protein ACRC6E_13040, partial [Fusobacteriaceae bacterium]